MTDFLSDSDDNSHSHGAKEAWTGFDADGSIASFSSIMNPSLGFAAWSAELIPIVTDMLRPGSSIWTTSRFTRTMRNFIGMLTVLFVIKGCFTHLVTALVCLISIFKQSRGSELYNLTGFMTYYEKFLLACLRWAVMTYQPVRS
jgi:hypothetical protein